MGGKKIAKEAKTVMMGSLMVGIVLLVVGLVFRQGEIAFLSNSKAMFALSLLPLSLAFVSYLKLSKMRKSPEKMRNMIIKESDERLVALNHEADAKTFKIVQGALFLAYFGYTFMFPEEVFSSGGWWVLLILLLGSMLLQAMFRHLLGKSSANDGRNE